MQVKNCAITLPTGVALADSSHPAAETTTSSAVARAASAVAVTQQDDSNWAGYLVGSSATKKTSFSAVSGSWTQSAADCAAGSPSHSAFWVGRTGSITSGLGPVSALTLEANPGFGRLYATAAQADASPGALSGNGSSFTVTGQRPEVQMPSPPVIVSGPIYN
jgi:hypothetical protein